MWELAFLLLISIDTGLAGAQVLVKKIFPYLMPVASGSSRCTEVAAAPLQCCCFVLK
jgi:hypothetical protein